MNVPDQALILPIAHTLMSGSIGGDCEQLTKFSKSGVFLAFFFNFADLLRKCLVTTDTIVVEADTVITVAVLTEVAVVPALPTQETMTVTDQGIAVIRAMIVTAAVIGILIGILIGTEATTGTVDWFTERANHVNRVVRLPYDMKLSKRIPQPPRFLEILPLPLCPAYVPV